MLANYLTGPPIPPDPDEALSRKDTVKSYPETVTRIVINEFEPPTERIAGLPGSGTELPATYVQHCHILEHEDDDLMRPWTIVGDDHDHSTGDHAGCLRPPPSTRSTANDGSPPRLRGQRAVVGGRGCQFSPGSNKYRTSASPRARLGVPGRDAIGIPYSAC